MRARHALSAMCACLLAVVPIGASAQGAAGPATPEAAVAAYVEAIAAGDDEAILAATAVDEMASGFDFEAYAERLQALALTTSMAPSGYPAYADMNRYQMAAQILGQVRNLAYGLLSDETIDGSVIAPVDEARIAAFVAAVDPSRLGSLTLIDARFPDPDIATDERYLANAAAQAAVFGADELTERLALVELDGETYGLGVTLLRYGDAWKVSNQSSPIGGTSPLGTAEPMTRAEFESRTAG